MVAVSKLDQAIVTVLREVVPQIFLKGAPYSKERLRRVWTARVNSNFHIPPSSLDRKKGGIAHRVGILSELILSLSPGKSGHLPKVVVPNGWEESRILKLSSSVHLGLLDAASALEKRLARLRQMAHLTRGICTQPSNLIQIDAKTASTLISVVVRDVVLTCSTHRLAPSFLLTHAAWTGVCCLMRLSDPDALKNAHKILRLVDLSLRSPRTSPATELFEQKMRRISVLEDKLRRMGFPVK